jgi:diketogulonate reductase-like aldo/keto reductase
MITIGTHSLRAEECVNTIKLALQVGYRRIDTASAYKNEHLVAQGISQFLSQNAGKVSRKDIHVTTKVGPKDIAKGFEGVKKCVQQSLKHLKISSEKDDDDDESSDYYIDCVLLHWPGAAGIAPESDKHAVLRREAWKALCEMKQSGLVREIGVSNFLVRHLDSLFDDSDDKSEGKKIEKIDVVQMELHPWCQQKEVVDWCHKHGVSRIESYGLFGGGKCLEKVSSQQLQHQTKGEEDGDQQQKQEKVNIIPNAAHLLLQWCVRQGFVPVVRATKQIHLEQNLHFLNTRPIRDCFTTNSISEEDGQQQKDEQHFYWHANLIA